MKSFTSIVALATFLTQASAAPAPQVNGATGGVDHAPSTNWLCGGKLYTPNDIVVAQQYAVNIQNQNPPVFHGRKDSVYPNGRFPHQFINTTPPLEYAAYCDDEANRKTYPIVQPGRATPYTGSINSNTNWGDDRVLYIQLPGDVHSVFCGLLTHAGQATGAFDYCVPQNAA